MVTSYYITTKEVETKQKKEHVPEGPGPDA
jgi:hypothetical protein